MRVFEIFIIDTIIKIIEYYFIFYVKKATYLTHNVCIVAKPGISNALTSPANLTKSISELVFFGNKSFSSTNNLPVPSLARKELSVLR